MSTTKTFNNIKSGKRHQIDATARGYYDFRTTVIPQPNKPLSFDMRVYDGLKYDIDLSKNSVRPGEINFDGTILPYLENNKLTKTNYVFGNSGTNYDLPIYEEVYSNITKVGDVSINNGIASNFSASNYLDLGNLDFSGDYEIVLKFKMPETDSDTANYKPFFDAKTNAHFYIGLSNYVNGNRYIHSDSGDGNNWYTGINGTTPLELNTEYYIKISRSGTTRTMYLSTDNVTWSEEGIVDDTYTYNVEYCLGAVSYLQSSDIFKGSFDLKESKITIGENIINLGDTTLFPKYDLTFNANSSASYIKGSSLVGIGGNVTIQNIKLNPTDKIKISYKYESGYNEIMKLGPLYLTATWVRNSGILPYLYYKTSESETSFNTYKQLGNSLVKDQWYNVEITMINLNNLKVGFSIGENNEEYTYFDITNGYFTEGTYECTINGSSCNEINFSGLPGLIQLTESKTGIFQDYEDNGKAKTLNAFSSNNEIVVLSPNENIVDYTYLGTVNIPKHIINWGEPSTPDPDTPTIDPSTLKFGDRIDNKATVVGTYDSNDGKKYAFAVLDSTYYGKTAWSSGLNGTDTGLPNYSPEPNDEQNKESATYNTDYIINNYSDKAIEAFTFVRNAGNLTFNGKKYKCQLPNAYELQQIYNNRAKLYELDPTASSNTAYNLKDWWFGDESVANVWSSNEFDSGTAWLMDLDGAWLAIDRSEISGVVPILEIELS